MILNIQFNNISRKKKGGGTTIDIYHSGTFYTRIKLVVNGIDYSYLNALSTGGAENFKGPTYFTVRHNPG